MKKWILTLLVVVCALCSALGLAACVPDKYNGGHNYSESWTHNEDAHWHKCIDCSRTTAMTEHDLVLIQDEVNYREPTCKTVGRGLYQCVDCGAYVVDVIPTIEHDYEFSYWIIEPTCDTDGRAMDVCTECGDPVSRVVKATGEHEYNTKWYSAGKDTGHYQICKLCGESSPIEEHVEFWSSALSSPVSGSDDGVNVYVCEVCGETTREEVVENTSVPASLKVTFKDVEVEDDEYGNHVIHINPNTQYSIIYTAMTKLNTMVSSLTFANMDRMSGIRVFLVDEKINKEDNLLDINNRDPITFGATSSSASSSYIKAVRSGEFLVRFKYETSVGTNRHKVRATYDVRVIVGTRAVNANALGVQMGAIDDATVCLAIGAYESKAH